MDWNRRSPTVYRFLPKRYVDEFFSSGRLRLSSFKQFARHADEQRLDGDEGTVHLLCRADESSPESLLTSVSVGSDAYVLSASLLPSAEVMAAFRADSAIVVRDPVSFGRTVGEAIPGVVCGFDGPCSYSCRSAS